MRELFLLPNQLVLFFRVRPGWLFRVAGDPGRSDVKLSCDERGRRPKNLRTEPGRLLPVGLAGCLPGAFSLVAVCCKWDSGSGDALADDESRCCGK